MDDPADSGDGSVAPLDPAGRVAEIRWPAETRPVRLLEWKVKPGALINVDSVIALCVADHTDLKSGPEERDRTDRPSVPDKKLKSDRAGVVKELCCQLGQVIHAGDVIAKIEECSHPIVMKGLCAECGQDLTQLQNKNGKRQAPISTATVSMVHSVPELMVSSEQAEQLGREDQKRLQRNRKLVLMVDLDQTLIHTTDQPCQRISNKGTFHFQLGRGEPMLHTRLRPHCKVFLEKIAKMYELHVFTFGSRLYAHTIAGFLDPEKKLFSHRILSRDECIDPYSKTGNLKNLFPCGDSMVCIIDDREDVWKFAPNLITVRKYVYFKGTGDINASLGSRDGQLAKKDTGTQASHPVGGSDLSATSEHGEQSNGFRKHDRDCKAVHEDMSTFSCDFRGPTTREESHSEGKGDGTEHLSDKYSVKGEEAGVSGRVSNSGEIVHRENMTTADNIHNDLNFDPLSDSETDSGKAGLPQSKNEEQFSETGTCTQTKVKEDSWVREGNGDERIEALEENQGVLSELDNGSTDKKETETESQNSEQSGITMGEESLDHSMGDEEDEEEEEDTDDHLIYLEEVLVRIHKEYYLRYEAYLRKESLELPDVRKIVPELKSRSLAGTTVVFSGLYPTNYPMERTRECYHAKALGAKIGKSLVLTAKDPDRTTHLIAARAGTEKVRQAQGCKHLHVVNPDWLWRCLERWERVEEQLFPLKEGYIKSQRSNSPSAFPDVQESLSSAVIHPTPVQPKCPLFPVVRTYDPVTGKLIRRGPQATQHTSHLQPHRTLPGHEVHSNLRSNLGSQQQEEVESLNQDDEKHEPSRRKRQPSMSETMPLYTLCKEDLESMDKEVDDILGEESDHECEEKEKEGKMEQEKEAEEQPQNCRQRAGSLDYQDLGTVVKDTLLSSSSLSESISRGQKRKLEEAKEEDDEVNNDDDKDGDLSSESSKDSNGDGSSSEADEMAAALEAELNDFI
ncbi:RNA polymerase II subunit A C-terminal domain phosphatase [Pygocentrus nattereri]|uniref:RNA polymerase II subunit A C-terminal domain phosphatase n=1 Tax=Pygocentrus nattereri TaxID=42514 RepID=A0A3B4DS03_PYGNA|nr:RNA polymerase II subunit A C-terminal domain phosphatase [Pygocentrus nattereri]